MENLEKGLIEIGLNEKEAKVYLAIVALGKAGISDIAKKTLIKRTSVYEYVAALLGKNYLYKTVKKKRVLYLAEKPEKILRSFESRKKKLETLLPELSTLYQLGAHQPNVRFYDGSDGLRSIYQEMSQSSKTIYSVFSVDKYYQVFSEQDGIEFMENIMKNGGQLRDLVGDTKEGRSYAMSKVYSDIKVTKILPKDFNLVTELLITGNKVAMISLVNLVGVVIENAEIADTQRSLVKFLFKHA